MRRRKILPVEVIGEFDFSVRNPGPIILFNSLLQQMRIKEIVNDHCPADPRLDVPVGEVIVAMALNRLCAPEPLLHVAEWAQESGLEFLLGTPVDALNDDRLGRALDAVFMRRWNILADVALHVSHHFQISLSKVHYDPTSFHFTGEYDNQSESPSLVPELKPFRIEVGRHSRPGQYVKEAQVGVNLTNDGKGPLPFFYHSANGSDNGHTAIAKNLQNLLKYIKPKTLLMVTDRGCFSAHYAVQVVRHHRFHFISSVTWREEFAELFDTHKPMMREALFLSLKEQQKRERGHPEATWERYYIGEIPYKITHNDESIRARLIFVRSTADMKISRETREKYTQILHRGLEKIKQSVENGRITDIDAVYKKINTLFGKKGAQKYFSFKVAALTPEQINAAPPRRKGQRKQLLSFTYHYHPELAERDEKYDGLYVLNTSLPKRTHSTDDVFTAFKEQHHIETAHHQWKAPLRLRPLFLKKPKRLESLVFVQFLALMAFYLIQRLYRNAHGVSCRTTAETLIRHFALCPIAFRYEKNCIQVIPGILRKPQAEVIKMLGFPPIEKQIQEFVIPQNDESDGNKLE